MTDQERIIELRQAGLAIPAIAAVLNVSPEAVEAVEVGGGSLPGVSGPPAPLTWPDDLGPLAAGIDAPYAGLYKTGGRVYGFGLVVALGSTFSAAPGGLFLPLIPSVVPADGYPASVLYGDGSGNGPEQFSAPLLWVEDEDSVGGLRRAIPATVYSGDDANATNAGIGFRESLAHAFGSDYDAAHHYDVYLTNLSYLAGA